MRVLGIDCGTERTGYGVIETDGRDHRFIAAGVIRTSPREPLEKRLHEIHRALRSVISIHAPEESAVEQVFHATNAQSTMKLCHVRGIALLAIAESGLRFAEYSPNTVKQHAVGFGHAGKGQVQHMVRAILRLDREIESEDAADALAVAICHASHAGIPARGAAAL